MLATIFSLVRQLMSVAYVLFLLRQFYRPESALFVLPTHVFASIALVYLWKPLKIKGEQTSLTRLLDLAAVAVCIGIICHYLRDALRIETRIDMFDPVHFGDKFAFCVGLPLLFEAVRRSGGMGLLSVVLAAFAYGFVGKYLPLWLKFPGFPFNDYVEITVLGIEGVFGVAANAIVYVVFYFIFFGAAFSATGGGRIFIDLAMTVTGRLVGGSAKTAVVASALNIPPPI